MTRRPELDADERALLDAGHHEQLARMLRAHGRSDAAGWVLEQIWDFIGAMECYVASGDALAALRAAIDSEREDAIARAIDLLQESAEPDVFDQGIRLLRGRGRHLEAARLMTRAQADPRVLAATLQRGGDSIEAARVLARAGLGREALDRLASGFSGTTAGLAHALAAEISWTLGDAEGTAHHAQLAVRSGAGSPEVRAMLARALGSLGHDLAAQIVLEKTATVPEPSELPGRYRVTDVLPANLTGAAYVGFDRVTLQEVEVHLLLAEHLGDIDDESIRHRLENFARDAKLAASCGHPAIRPIVRIDPTAGLLVMPRAEGPSLRSLIRPHKARTPGRARAMIAFLLEGLMAAGAHGLAHGSLLPGQIVCDAAGRPMLGPFGVHWLAGLAATRTGGLEEILHVTAPELRAGGPPTQAADVYSLGVLFAALVRGGFEPANDDPPDAELDRELELARTMMRADPEQRPDPRDLLEALRTKVADIRDVRGPLSDESGSVWQTGEALGPGPSQVIVTATSSWTNEELDALSRATDPYLQPILDRAERTFVLAPWPAGCRTLGGFDTDIRSVLVPDALDRLPESARSAVERRLRPSSVVATPAGEWMIALDDLLARDPG